VDRGKEDRTLLPDAFRNQRGFHRYTPLPGERQQMIPKECKRLAEVDFPIAAVSRHSVKEKSIRSGHPSTLHLWWARRPLAACRAMLMALLLPDPCDPNCPGDFKTRARAILPRVQGRPGARDVELRTELLRFIGDFSNWDNSSSPVFLEAARGLVRAAYGDETPLVVDPFAGGGSIPLEALRIGCDAFASDLNPVACLILKTLLEDIPRHGSNLTAELRTLGAKIRAAAQKELAEFYAPDPDGSTPIAYLWARTITCDSCGAEIPLVRSFWLCNKAKHKRALRYTVIKSGSGPPRLQFEIFEPKADQDVPDATVSLARATCPSCHVVLAPDRVRHQLSVQHGGADVEFDSNGSRIGGAILIAVATVRASGTERRYRIAANSDYEAVKKAHQRAAGSSPGRFPDEPIVQERVSKNSPFRMHLYGCRTFGDLFNVRQKVAISALQSVLQDTVSSSAAKTLFALSLGKAIRHWNAFSKWHRKSETVAGSFALQAISMSWDYPEMSPFADYAGGLQDILDNVIGGAEGVPIGTVGHAQVALNDACEQILPDDSAACWFTDPPYYDAIPYSDISDAFYVWHKRTLPHHPLLTNIYEEGSVLTPKVRELIQDDNREMMGEIKDERFFERRMAVAFSAGRRVLANAGVACVVFAHKSTEGWEALLSGLIAAGWTVTCSWPIATERGARLRARASAALSTSVHLVCRPRPEDASIGDWADVLRELPVRVGQWIEKLQSEGIRGADLVFACIGPAMEVYSRYSKVEDAEGREIPLGGDPTASEPYKRGFLAYVWETVGRLALEQVLGTAEARARNGAAGALEEDSRLTALFLWTLQATESAANDTGDDVEDQGENDEEEDSPKKKKAGLTLIYDVTRRFAQPLGIHLDKWEGRIIETEKGVVRLLPVAERAMQLFGDVDASAISHRIEQDVKASRNYTFAFMQDVAAPPEIKPRGRRRAAASGIAVEEAPTVQPVTTLDRVHAAMLLQASGQANGLRAMLKEEQQRGPDFLRLANALSALYPKDSEEKRLLDAMLLAVPRS
jgi:putative DNA methylase